MGPRKPRRIEALVPLVYGELYRLAHSYMSGERPGHTVQTTALVNEAYVRLVDSAHANWESRSHFFGVCAQVMRRILVDWAGSRQALKRAGNESALDLNEVLVAANQPGQPGTDLVAVDDALETLAAVDTRKARVVELRFLRWAEREGNRRGIESFRGDRASRLEVG